MTDYYQRKSIVTVELVDKTASLATIIKWVQGFFKMPMSVYSAKPYAEAIKNSDAFHPDIRDTVLKTPMSGAYNFSEQIGICLVTVEIGESEFEKSRKEQYAFWDLCKLGAEGDAEAAIAFCKAELEGKVSHGVFA